MTLRAGTHIWLGNRVVASEHDRDQACIEHLADSGLDRLMGALGVGREYGCVPVVDDPQLRECVDPRLELRPRRTARSANRPRTEPGTRPIGDQIVGWSTDDRDIEAHKERRILRKRRGAIAQRAREVRLLAVTAPALERVDHRAIVARSKRACTRASAPSMSPATTPGPAAMSRSVGGVSGHGAVGDGSRPVSGRLRSDRDSAEKRSPRESEHRRIRVVLR